MYTFFWPKDIFRYLDIYIYILLAYRQKYICYIYVAYVVSSFFEYAYFRMCTCRYIHIHIHTFIFVACMYRCTSVHAYLLTCIIYLERLKYEYTCAYTHVYTCTHTHSYSVSYLHKKTHTRGSICNCSHFTFERLAYAFVFVFHIYIPYIYTYNYIYIRINIIVCSLHLIT